MKLERHVGGLSNPRKVQYLERRGWVLTGKLWRRSEHEDAVPLKKAVHHQLTADLALALSRSGWKVEDYSDRGYAKMRDPRGGPLCSLPAALRRQAKREKRLVGEFTYSLFLGAVL